MWEETLGLLRSAAPYKLWDSTEHPASPLPMLGAGTPRDLLLFSAWELLVEKSLTLPKVLGRGLTPLGHWKFCFILFCF